MRRSLLLPLVCAVVCAACARTGQQEVTPLPGASAAASPSQAAFTRTMDVVYFERGGRQFLLDVWAPEGEGPWPVAVAFHGNSPSLKNDSFVTAVARAAAEAGVVVFVPSWVEHFSSSVLAADLTGGFEAAACALAYAQQEAAAYGGDSTRIVTYGFSAGSPEAAWLALGHGASAVSGCVAAQPAGQPVGAVLGDSEYFLHSELFQEGFDTDPGGMLKHVAALVDPGTWPDGLSARFRLWSAADGTQARSFDDAWAEDGWLAQRDPDGSIRHDLDALGELDDGVISFIDEGMLLTARLQATGLDATHDLYPGGHTVGDKLPELVGYLLDAASAG